MDYGDALAPLKVDGSLEVHAPDPPTAENSGRPPPWSRLTSRLAVVTGVLACSAAAVVLQRRASAAAKLASLRTPFRIYDETMPGCKPMPSRADQYDGLEDERPITVEDKDEDGTVNVFVIGDWGATLPNHITFAPGCCDSGAQFNVANAFKARAKWADPQYVLNVGDNFYVAGLDTNCQQAPGDGAEQTKAAYSSAWQQMYGPVANKPWISVLGNHDYGGFRMDKGWPQQIGYSFMNYNWIMPGRFYTKRINHTGFYIDYFMIDSNAFDAKDWGVNPDHNICSGAHNAGGMGTCANNGGMTSVQDCKHWFWKGYEAQKEWLEAKIKASKARWKIVVTHFPCGYDTEYWKRLKTQHGLDLLVTGHRHQQELWKPGSTSKYISSFLLTNKWDEDAPACFVTGGGGGIISQKFGYADYGADLQWYGFFHLTVNKDWMKIELVATDNKVAGNMTIYPHGSKAAKEHAGEAAKPNTAGYICDSFCGDANNPWSKVCAWGSAPWMSCTGCKGCSNACEYYCGNAANPWSKVCPWGSAPWSTCHDCHGCHTTTGAPGSHSDNHDEKPADNIIHNCDSYCGDPNNPFWKVCPWGESPFDTCKDCDGCYTTTHTTTEGPAGSHSGNHDDKPANHDDKPADNSIHHCDSYCGDPNNPFSKVCPWGETPWDTCKDCDGCTTTTKAPQ